MDVCFELCGELEYVLIGVFCYNFGEGCVYCC